MTDPARQHIVDELVNAVADRLAEHARPRITRMAELEQMTHRQIEHARRAGAIDLHAVAADRDRLAAENAARIRQRHDPNQEKTSNG